MILQYSTLTFELLNPDPCYWFITKTTSPNELSFKHYTGETGSGEPGFQLLTLATIFFHYRQEAGLPVISSEPICLNKPVLSWYSVVLSCTPGNIVLKDWT